MTRPDQSVRLDDLRPGVKLSGLLPEPVAILAVDPHGPGAATVTFKDIAGGFGQRLLCPADEARLAEVPPESR